jgi:hypothetical protein
VSLSVAVTTQANIRKEKAMVDIGASVPKNPVVRKLYVDAVSRRPIDKWFNLYIFFFVPFNNINGFYFFFVVDEAPPQVPQSPTCSVGQLFRNCRLVLSPVKMKYSHQKEVILRRLVVTENPILNYAHGLKELLATPDFADKTRSLSSIRTKIRDLKKQLQKGIGGL